MIIKKILLALTIITLSSCAFWYPNSLILTPKNNMIDLSIYGTSKWSTVCILGPYSTNADAERTLGFASKIIKQTAIDINDGFVVFVYSNGQKVLEYYEVSRKYDFSNQAKKCFDKGNALFKLENNVPEHKPMQY